MEMPTKEQRYQTAYKMGYDTAYYEEGTRDDCPWHWSSEAGGAWLKGFSDGINDRYPEGDE